MNNAVLYINGLGDGEWHYRQRMLAKDLESYGYELEHSHLNWLSNKSFQEHLEETTEKAESILRNQGKLAIVGSSAGGSMAMNVFKELDSENAIAVNMCGRLAEGTLAGWDWRKLTTMAHLGTSRASRSFYDSVKFCETETAPSLTARQKKQLFIFHQLFDFVVPHQTMLIQGVQDRRLPAIGHGLGIFLAGRMLPAILKEKQDSL